MNIKLYLDAGNNEELRRAFAEYETAYQKLMELLQRNSLTFLTLTAEGKMRPEEEE